MTTRWLFGDQLGPHCTDDHRGPLLMAEGLDRLSDLPALVEQEDARGNRAP